MRRDSARHMCQGQDRRVYLMGGNYINFACSLCEEHKGIRLIGMIE